MVNLPTPHINDVYKHEQHHDYLVYGYLQQLIATYGKQLTAKQIDHVFDLLRDPNKFQLLADPDILASLFYEAHQND